MAQWNPLHDLVSLQDRMNRLLKTLQNDGASEADQSDEVKRGLVSGGPTFTKTRWSTR